MSESRDQINARLALWRPLVRALKDPGYMAQQIAAIEHYANDNTTNKNRS